MGKVRTEHIKRIAKELLNRFPNKFSEDFETNKHLVDLLVPAATNRVRNKIAGYITHIISISSPSHSSEKQE